MSWAIESRDTGHGTRRNAATARVTEAEGLGAQVGSHKQQWRAQIARIKPATCGQAMVDARKTITSLAGRPRAPCGARPAALGGEEGVAGDAGICMPEARTMNTHVSSTSAYCPANHAAAQPPHSPLPTSRAMSFRCASARQTLASAKARTRSKAASSRETASSCSSVATSRATSRRFWRSAQEKRGAHVDCPGRGWMP